LGYSNTKLHQRIIPTLYSLADIYDEIHWDDRLNQFNHIPYFPPSLTGIVDTLPVYVQQPSNSTLKRLLYNPKYGGTVYKLQLGIDFLGRIILFTGPHLGVQYDGDIWKSTSAFHPTRIGELLLGDGHYIQEHDVLSPHKKPPGGMLTFEEEFYNAAHSFFRARGEHSNAIFNRHDMFQKDFRGGFDLLAATTHVTAHTTNVDCHYRVRYEMVGPYQHVFVN